MFNEEEFLPVFLAHYERQEVDEIVLLDHGSTDASCDIARASAICRIVETPEQIGTTYSYEVDARLCNAMLDLARSETSEPTWWLFPDVDELLSADPTLEGETIREYLSRLVDVDGVGCVGVHCLPRIEKSFEWTDTDQVHHLLSKFPPRSFEAPVRSGESWKNTTWMFRTRNPEPFQDQLFSVGSHVLVGPKPLRMHTSCLAAFHFKIRSVESYTRRVRESIARTEIGDGHLVMLEEKLAIASKWAEDRYRLLRLGRSLSSNEIGRAMRTTRGQGHYLKSPVLPRSAGGHSPPGQQPSNC